MALTATLYGHFYYFAILTSKSRDHDLDLKTKNRAPLGFISYVHHY